jgi:hypothetical protein
MVWATPAVQTLAAPAFAAGTPKCLPTIVANYSKPAQASAQGGKEKSGCTTYTFSATEACCDCIDRLPHLPRPLAILACKFLLKCRLESVTTC